MSLTRVRPNATLCGVALLLAGCAPVSQGIYSRSAERMAVAALPDTLTLRFTVPTTLSDSAHCEGVRSATVFAKVRVYWMPQHPRWRDWPVGWREEMPLPVLMAERAARAPGTRDSLKIKRLGAGTYWITHVGTGGHESCPSNYVGSP